MIDWNLIESLKEDIGAEDFGDVVLLFLEEVETAIAQIQQRADDTELEGSLHFLKGCAMNLGFSEFARLCAEGESTAATGKGHLVDLAALFQSYEVSKTAFQDQISL